MCTLIDYVVVTDVVPITGTYPDTEAVVEPQKPTVGCFCATFKISYVHSHSIRL